MRLVLDTNVVVGESLRRRGAERFLDGRLELFMPADTHEEVGVEVRRRAGAVADQRGLTEAERELAITRSLDLIRTTVTVVGRPTYSLLERVARRRTPRDPDDWPLVACAIAIRAGIWTHDRDMFGTGVTTWVSDSLQGWLDLETGDGTRPY
ncbi:MAG: nucleotide-binding protein, PIN domain-containing protein [Chloroflexi bacterium]|nr:nucleotide-binding protein, PIN domain-containing protein [Chloroflexota bacterium]